LGLFKAKKYGIEDLGFSGMAMRRRRKIEERGCGYTLTWIFYDQARRVSNHHAAFGE